MNATEFRETVLASLSPREEKFVRMYFGVPPYTKRHSPRDIANEFDFPAERVEQILVKAAKKIMYRVFDNHCSELFKIYSPPESKQT